MGDLLRSRDLLPFLQSSYTRPLLLTTKSCDDCPIQIPGTLQPDAQVEWIKRICQQRCQSTTLLVLVGKNSLDAEKLFQWRKELQSKYKFVRVYLLLGGLEDWMIHAMQWPQRFQVQWKGEIDLQWLTRDVDSASTPSSASIVSSLPPEDPPVAPK